MDKVRLGIVGLGNMGSEHARNLPKLNRVELGAVCDLDSTKLDRYDAPKFDDAGAMIRSGAIDAILIATPHYFHTTIGIDALQQGLHVLSEKPISVHKADCERLIAAHTDPSRVFAAMFNQRTDPRYRKLRGLIQSGELGEIQRVNWIITNWFRSAAYYASGGWRATWRGEGGGVLLNQCPHNLDLLQWIVGMPNRVRATCAFGKYHDIEVEDEVTAMLEFPNGATGVFVTTTGEAPGTNRLEIVGDRGKVVLDENGLRFWRTTVSVREFRDTTPESFSSPETWDVRIHAESNPWQHNVVLQNFVDSILDGKPLIAPAREGIHSVELANAMLLSTFLNDAVEIPLDASVYEAELMRRIETSRYEKKGVAAAPVDMSSSYGR